MKCEDTHLPFRSLKVSALHGGGSDNGSLLNYLALHFKSTKIWDLFYFKTACCCTTHLFRKISDEL